jgi:hypothetical protein
VNPTGFYLDNISVKANIRCTFTVTPASASFPASGGKASAVVTTQDACQWPAAENMAWISITSGPFGAGDGKVDYSVAVNKSLASRTGSIAIAGKHFKILQAGAYPSNLSASAVPFSGISLTWTDNSNDEDGFRIERKTGKCTSANAWSEIASVAPDVTFVTDSSLQSWTDYSYRVRAYNDSANSLYSNCVSIRTGFAGISNQPAEVLQ